MRNIETIQLDWYDDFGITVYGSDCAFEDVSHIPPDMSIKYNNIRVGETKRFEHKEYAFWFSSHELRNLDLKEILTHLEKVLVAEWWGLFKPFSRLDPIRFNGKLQPFDLRNIFAIVSRKILDEFIGKGIGQKKDEMPVFFRRIPWELHVRPKPVWYPDTGYKDIVCFETAQIRKPTTDEIVNNASLYTRFSTGFV